MRIVHLLVGSGWGGAERLATALARECRSRGDDVQLAATPYGAPFLANEALPILPMADAPEDAATDPRARPLVLFRWSLRVREALRLAAHDLVHVHLSTPAFLAAAHLAVGGRNAVWTFHLLPEARWPLDFMTRLPSRWMTRMAGLTMNRRFVAVSRSDATELERLLPSAHVVSIRNAPPPFEPSGRGVTRAAWGNAEIALLFVGRLDAQKGLDRLLVALAHPSVARHPVRLVVGGDGPEREALGLLVERLGLRDRVSFVGPIAPRSAFEAADLVLCPSRYEGTPLVPMEAVLCGAAVVVSRIPSTDDLFREVPGSFLPADEERWPDCLASLVVSAEKRAALRADQRALIPRFAFSRLVDEYRRVYNTPP